ncbi:MAG: FtsX-like permease family protein [Clostridia bacterium]|nr:FtsX-like permease family protein [Clostridia bacterium]
MVRRRDSGKGRGVLTKKLFRDMRQSAMQFFAMLMLCFLGTWTLAGLDANWRMMELSFDTYFTEQNLADLWVRGSGFSPEERKKVAHLESVDTLIPRTNLTVDCPELGDTTTLNLIAFDGAMAVNTPIVRSGAPLVPGDVRGLLLEEQFADAHGLTPGDRITLRLPTGDTDFTIRGIVLSPEFIVTSNDAGTNPETFGFALADRSAVANLPVNEFILKLKPGTTPDSMKPVLSDLLPGTAVLTERTNGGTSFARNFVEMFRAMCYIFPVLVYAVATMIVVSTLSRMIENQRIQMGTLKALGYGNAKIRNHYLSYALVPSLAGSLIGLIAAQFTLPDIIWGIMTHNARMPYKLRPQISPLSWAAFVGTVLLSLFVCLVVYRKAARECTAELLRPKPPKSGTRILLERWRGFWERLSFNGKMVVRNIFRNKGRSFLSAVGIFCCNMLIVCSFSLQDSIPQFINDYYTKTRAYDVEAVLKTGKAGDLAAYRARMGAEIVDGQMQKSVSVIGPLGSRTCPLTVLPDDVRTVRLGKGGTETELPDTGASVSEKLCRILGVEPGDTLTVYFVGDTEPVVLPVRSVADTSIGQGIFLGESAWNALRKGPFVPTSLLIRGPSDRLMHELNESDAVSELKYPSEQNKKNLSIMDSTTTIFSILSGAALLLAFIICYNMGLMNFTERTRDYATLKVLGYHQKEIRRIMMREQQLISVPATLLGVWPGMLLTDIILKLCEFENMVFSSSFKPLSVIGACAISILFAWAIEALLTLKVKKIDMVEALKSVE